MLNLKYSGKVRAYPSYLREIDVVKKNFLVFIVLKSDFDARGCAEFRRVAVVGIRRDIGIFQSGRRRMEGGPPPGGRKEALLAALARQKVTTDQSLRIVIS